MGWLIALAAALLIASLAWLPLVISFRYNGHDLQTYLLIGVLRLRVRLDSLLGEDSKKQGSLKQGGKTAEGTPEGQDGLLNDFLLLIRLLLDLLSYLRDRVQIKLLQVDLVLGNSDPCDLAQNYGRACAAMGAFLPRLEEFFEVRKRDVQIRCDFDAEETLVTGRLDVGVTLWRLVSIIYLYGQQIKDNPLFKEIKEKVAKEHE